MEKNHKSIGWLLCLGILSVFLGKAEASAGTHEAFTTLLKQHVSRGRVDYAPLCQDASFYRYLDHLSSTDPASFSGSQEQLAYWINTYNAYTLKLICDHYPLRSISELHRGGLILGTVTRQTAWDRKIVRVQEKTLSLNYVEHQILRKEFKDPRIHFAIVCAAKGCPDLRSEAYEANLLDEQLNDQGRQFLADPIKNRVDVSRRRAELSPIFSWFREDFGGNNAELLKYLAGYLPPEAAASIRQDPRAWRVGFTKYDWSLNDQKP